MYKIFSPLLMGTGVSIFLFGNNDHLPINCYISPLIFWVIGTRPLGILWKQRVLKPINDGLFPKDLNNYRAIAYDLFLNHTIFHSSLALLLLSYTYIVRTLFSSNTTENIMNNFLIILNQKGLSMLKMRFIVASISIVSQYCISYFSLIRTSKTLYISQQSKRILMIKQMLLQTSWFSYILNQFHFSYDKIYQNQ